MTTIVQITDTHITAGGRLAYGKVDTHAALAQTVTHINALPQRIGPIDAVVVTGDLTDLASPEEYAAFRDLTRDLAPPMFVLPGNHDDRTEMRRAFPDAGYFSEGDEPLDYSIMIGDLHVVALDSTVPGKPHGELGTDQMRWLERTLDARPEDPAIVLLHHPPFETGIGHMDRQRLMNGAALIEVLSARPQVRLVSAGHVHRWISATIDRLACMIAPAPAHAVTLDTTPDGPSTFMREPGAVVVHRWHPMGAAGNLTSFLSFVGQHDGPHPFFGVEQKSLLE